MKTKVTSYELSKKLSELGFDSQTHCGWWWLYEDGDIELGDKEYPEYAKVKYIASYKAYDCHDLLTWLSNYSWKTDTDYKLLLLSCESNYFIEREGIDYLSGDQDEPQNALASAIVKILEEGK